MTRPRSLAKPVGRCDEGFKEQSMWTKKTSWSTWTLRLKTGIPTKEDQEDQCVLRRCKMGELGNRQGRLVLHPR